MTKVITEITQSLYDTILKENVVYAQTNFENEERIYAYKFLANCAKMENFFFGMQVETEAQLEAGRYHAHTYAPGQSLVLVHLEIPDEELYKCALYDFGDLICVTGIELEPDPKWQLYDEERIKHSVLTDGTDDDAIQVVYNRIEKDWIIDVERKDTKHYDINN